MRITTHELMSKYHTGLVSFRNIFELLGHLKMCASWGLRQQTNDPKAESFNCCGKLRELNVVDSKFFKSFIIESIINIVVVDTLLCSSLRFHRFQEFHFQP